ncbi:MAG: peptide ABC transporter substrate-binding protein [Rhodobacteraceae bacterium]|nr:peptide ABC transporter substrate-binding protein [Paracoccaceae bacterium]
MKRILIAILVVSTFVSSAIAQTILHRGNRFEPASLDPHKTQTHYESAVQHDLFEGLTAYDALCMPQPAIADSWKVSADGKRWTFKLRPGLRWSDGAPITADDVVFSFRRLLDPSTAAQYAQLMYLLVNARAINTGALPPDKLGISAPDAETVVMDLTNPAPYLPEILANAFASILPRHVIGAKGADWIKPENMAASGAFTLSEWQAQSRIVLVRNPNYRDAAQVKLDGVIYYPTADLSAAVQRFRAGELDLQFEFPTGQIDLLRSALAAETRISPSLLTYYLTFNSKVEKLSDPRVRRALSLAIDRDIITNKVLRTGEVPAFTLVPPATAGYTPPEIADAVLTQDARIAKARELLADAGYGPGNPLRLTYSHSSNEDLKRIAVAIQAMWRRVGVQAELLNREGRVHFAALKDGDFEAAFVGWAADYNDAATFLYILQSTTVNSNYARYNNPAFDALMDEAAGEADGHRRADLLRQAEAMALAEQPVAPLYYGVTKNLVSTRVRGWELNPTDFHLSRWVSLVEQ